MYSIFFCLYNFLLPMYMQVAVNEAMLGSMDKVLDCVRMTDVLKPTKEAAKELLSLMSGQSIDGTW